MWRNEGLISSTPNAYVNSLDVKTGKEQIDLISSRVLAGVGVVDSSYATHLANDRVGYYVTTVPKDLYFSDVNKLGDKIDFNSGYKIEIKKSATFRVCCSVVTYLRNGTSAGEAYAKLSFVDVDGNSLLCAYQHNSYEDSASDSFTNLAIDRLVFLNKGYYTFRLESKEAGSQVALQHTEKMQNQSTGIVSTTATNFPHSFSIRKV